MRTYEYTITERAAKVLVIGVELDDGVKFEGCVNLDDANADKLAALVRLRRDEFFVAGSIPCQKIVAAHQLTDTNTASSTARH